MAKAKDSPVWGETDEKKRFIALVSEKHAATGLKLKKGDEYLVPENKAGRQVFRPAPEPKTKKEDK